MEVNEKILKKATEMFLTYGVRNVTMDALAGELGVSKRTLYQKFTDKDTLVIECLRHMILENNKVLLGIIEESDNVVQAMVHIMKHQDEQRKQFPKVFMEDIKKYYQTVNNTFYSCTEDLKKFSASYTLIIKGVKQGIFRKDLRNELVDTFLHEVVSMLHNSERLIMLEPSPEEVLRNILLPYFRGISTPKGIALLDDYFENNDKK